MHIIFLKYFHIRDKNKKAYAIIMNFFIFRKSRIHFNEENVKKSAKWF